VSEVSTFAATSGKWKGRNTMGDQGVESILGVIYPPQVALVGFGRITDRPWAVDGMIGIRPIVERSAAQPDPYASDVPIGTKGSPAHVA
jgi:pyruvate dehydrogenase E2 component (dihydrolipoamide acetyltransferase)